MEGFAWSIGSTVLPVLAGSLLVENTGVSKGLGVSLVLGGLLVGPSMGQFVLGSPIQGTAASFVRAGGGVLVAIGFAQIIGSLFCGFDTMEDEESHCPDEDGTRMLLAGGFVYLGGTLYSLIDIPFAAKRERSRLRRVGLGPRIRPSSGGITPGLAAWVRF